MDQGVRFYSRLNDLNSHKGLQGRASAPARVATTHRAGWVEWVLPPLAICAVEAH